MKRLVLFDIDGTMLRGGGAGRAAMERALSATFGIAGEWDSGYRYDGKTDRQIIRELMRLAGHDDATIDARMSLVIQQYVNALPEELSNRQHHVAVHAGIRELIDVIHTRPDTVLGLLTGNVEPGARLKLSAVGLDMDRFVVNAFGSDHEARGELPAIAHRRMYDMFGVELAGRDVILIGDTPADISCGRALGARTIAVATGRFTVDELRAHDPFAVFPTLADTAVVLRAIDATEGTDITDVITMRSTDVPTHA